MKDEIDETKEVPKETKLPEHIEELMETPVEKKKPGPKKGSKREKKVDPKDEMIAEMLEEMKAMSARLAETEKRVAERPPASVRLDSSKKKSYQVPEWTGKMVKIKFFRNDQPQNPMSLKLRNHEIDWEGVLEPGKEYEVPEPVMGFINSRSQKKYGEVQDPENPRQTITQEIGEEQRCYCLAV